MSFPKDYKPFVPAETSSQDDESETAAREQSRAKKRHATVYDAVAGRVSERRDLHGEELKARSNAPKVIKHSTKETPLAPDEVLFRRRDAPERYLEHDIYHAHEWNLPNAGQGILPESDLLKAIHGYTSRFYAAKEERHHRAAGGRNVSERSMDETALLAFGILLEEAGREVLGRRGDLVFTEGSEVAPGSGGDEVAREDLRIVGHQDIGPWRRGPKRRKVSDAEPP